MHTCMQAMGTFYRDQLGIELSWRERRSLFSGWHFLNLGSDIMIIIGTATKFALDYNVSRERGERGKGRSTWEGKIEGALSHP